MKRFEAQVSLMTSKNDTAIWTIWTDVPSWPKWDDSSKTEINGAFEAGNIIRCFAEGEPEPRSMMIISVKKNEEFIDQTDLPFGKIMTYHIIRPLDGNIQVTHRMVAEIDDNMADMFGNEIWPHIQSGIFEALNGLINL